MSAAESVQEGASRPLLIKNVALVQSLHIQEGRSILVGADGIVLEVGPCIASLPENTVELDAGGCYLFPGLLDMQAHLNVPGREDRETLQSGALAALRGGYTSLVLMPDNTPPTDSGSAVVSLRNAVKHLPVRMLVAGTISKGRRGEELAELGAMQENGAVFMTDAPDAVENPLLMRRALDYARNLGILVASSPDLAKLTSYGLMNEGNAAYRLGLPGIPSCSEEIALVRDLRLAQSVKSSVHINQISTGGSVETVHRYKQSLGMQFTVGVTPHHLIFTEEVLVKEDDPYNTDYKVRPPLRADNDRWHLLEGLASREIDVISTDHSPFTVSEKEREFSAAPFGMSGLETALVALYHHVVCSGQLSLPVLIDAMAERPRQILEQPDRIAKGYFLDAVLFDPQGTTCIREENRASKSRNNPFLGQELRGRVHRICLGSRVLDPHALSAKEMNQTLR